ncbi:MAG: hypothetical protein ACYCSB_04170 [bacterium]
MEKQSIERFKNELSEHAENMAEKIVDNAKGSDYCYGIDIYVDLETGEMSYVSGFGALGRDDSDDVFVSGIKVENNDHILDFENFCNVEELADEDEEYAKTRYEEYLKNYIRYFTAVILDITRQFDGRDYDEEEERFYIFPDISVGDYF